MSKAPSIFTLLVSAVLAFGFIIVPLAQAAGPVVITNTNIPITNTVVVPCANNGQGDTIQLSGTLHELILVTLDNNGGFLLHITTNAQDLTGVSQTTGVVYHSGVGDSVTINGKVGFVQTFANSFILVGQGTAAKLMSEFDGHLTVNPDGTVTVTFTHESVRCL
jgi:hypothetical protein